MQDLTLFDKIPNELLLNIIIFIDDARTFVSFLRCCTRIRVVANTYLPNVYWRSLYAKKWYLKEQELKALGKTIDWRRLYFQRHERTKQILQNAAHNEGANHSSFQYYLCKILSESNEPKCLDFLGKLRAHTSDDGMKETSKILWNDEDTLEILCAIWNRFLENPQIAHGILKIFLRIAIVTPQLRTSPPFGYYSPLLFLLSKGKFKVGHLIKCLSNDKKKILLKLGLVECIVQLLNNRTLPSKITEAALKFLSAFQTIPKFEKYILRGHLMDSILNILCDPKQKDIVRRVAAIQTYSLIGYEGRNEILRRFLKSDSLERLIGILPTCSSIVLEELFYIFYYCLAFVSLDNERTYLIHECVRRLTPYADIFLSYLRHEDETVRRVALDYWRITVCAKTLPRDLSQQLLMEILNTLLEDRADFTLRLSYYSLAANIAVTDMGAMNGTVARTLGEFWAKDFVSSSFVFYEDNIMWSSFLIPAAYFQYPEFQQYIVTNTQVIEKLKRYSSNECDPLNRYRATMCLSYLYGTGKLEANILQYIRDYTRTVPVDIGWNLVFSSIEPYFHLFRSDIEELQLFGSWMLAHVSRTGICF
jgi:hypothetical protein